VLVNEGPIEAAGMRLAAFVAGGSTLYPPAEEGLEAAT